MQDKERKVHHGKNVKYAREWKNRTQTWLGQQLGKSQSDISVLEAQEIIEKELLQKLADLLEIDIDFLINFCPEEHMDRSISIENTNFQNTIEPGGMENVYFGSQQNGITNNIPYSEVKLLHQKLEEKQEVIYKLKLLLVKNGIDVDF